MIVQVWISDIKIFPRWRGLKRLHFWLAGYLCWREESVSLPPDVKTTFVDVFPRGGIFFYVGWCNSNQKPKQNVSLCSVKLSSVHFFKSISFFCRVVEALVSHIAKRLTCSVKYCAVYCLFCPKIWQFCLTDIKSDQSRSVFICRLVAGTSNNVLKPFLSWFELELMFLSLFF